MTKALARALVLVAALGAARAEEPSPVAAPGPEARCPVCGMFVARYEEWVAAARLADGRVLYFDGAKDLFKFLQAPGKYAPGSEPRDLVVTDYYEVEPLDAREAWYVLGSDVEGPMGAELVPHASQDAAEEFRADHRGRRILRFGEVDDAVLAKLD